VVRVGLVLRRLRPLDDFIPSQRLDRGWRLHRMHAFLRLPSLVPIGLGRAQGNHLRHPMLPVGVIIKNEFLPLGGRQHLVVVLEVAEAALVIDFLLQALELLVELLRLVLHFNYLLCEHLVVFDAADLLGDLFDIFASPDVDKVEI